MAMLAIGAFTAAAASAALPEFTEGIGVIHPMTFTGTSGQVLIHEAGGGTYECQSSTIKGEIVGPKEVAKVVVTFKGGTCTASFCQTSTGLWVTNELKGRIAYISKSSKTVGLLLEAVTEPMTTCSHFGVGGAKIQNSVIGNLTPVNEPVGKTFFLKYESQSEGIQIPQHFEGEELIHNLQILPTGAPSARKFSLAGTMQLTTSKAIRISA